MPAFSTDGFSSISNFDEVAGARAMGSGYIFSNLSQSDRILEIEQNDRNSSTID